MAREPLPVSVVIPTIGRAELLRECLESLARAEPRAAEVVVVDQSVDDDVATLAAGFVSRGVHHVRCEGRGVGLARNVGLRRARHKIVLVTDDDCTVAANWIETAWALSSEHPRALITGCVRAAGDPRAVPSTIDDPEPREYDGVALHTVLYPNNMVLRPADAVALGGFDDRVASAEDNDFCYRWLRAGRPIRYEPSLVVWHHDWRTREQLVRLYEAYGRGQGLFYAKHLLAGDGRVAAFLARDVYAGLRGLGRAGLRGRPEWPDPRRHVLAGLPRGLTAGWREFRRP